MTKSNNRIGRVMAGELNLNKLLASMSPELLPQTYVFYTLEKLNWAEISRLQPKSFFQEKEGLSLILTQQIADENNIDYDGVYQCITLNVHSSLEAVGLTAAVSAALTSKNISANVVAAFFHDHIFVNENDAQRAWQTLTELSSKP